MGVVAVLASHQALAVDAVPGTSATLSWAPASGAVERYEYFVVRVGGSGIEVGLTESNVVQLSGKPGDVVQVIVQALGHPNGEQAPFDVGPESEPSDPIRFDGAPVVKEAYPILDCASCGRSETRDLGNEPLLVAQHPSPGSWTLTGVGELVRGGLQAVFREDSTGALWVGDLWGGGMLPLASAVASGFDRMAVGPLTDLDGDGVAEIVLNDPVAGRIEVWGLVDRTLTRRAMWAVPPGKPLVGAGDRDSDGIPELWFDAKDGSLRVDRSGGKDWVVVSTGVIGFTPTDVADYDGDGLSDVLWRNENGDLLITLMRGDWDGLRVEPFPLVSMPGDANVEPRGSFDLTGDRGAEILLQDRTTGALDVALPFDPIPGRRQRLLSGDPRWVLVGMD